MRERKRKCDDPAPLGEGKDCVGPSLEQEDCNTNPCVGKYFNLQKNWIIACISHNDNAEINMNYHDTFIIKSTVNGVNGV